MAASITGGEADSTSAFAAAFVMARAVLLLMYSRARRHVPATQELVTGYLKGFGTGGAFWLISIWVPEPWRYVLWGIGLAIDFATPYVLRQVQAKAPLDVSHLPERFGLFTILVLGESIAAVVAGLSEVPGLGSADWELGPTVGAILGVLTAAGLWWLYFDNLEGSVVRRRPDQRTAWKPTAWIYSHLPLAVALTASGIGLEFLVSQEVTPAERWLVTGGVAASLIAMGMIHFSTERADLARDILQTRVRLAAAAVVLIVGLVSESWPANLLAAFLAAVCALQVLIDLSIAPSD